MKIVILSDLNWEAHLRSVSLSEVDAATLESIMIPRYYSIQRYLEIILEEKADLVIIAGDVTGDGSCGHGFHNAFKILLSALEQHKIESVFISGNHDEPVYYGEVLSYAQGLKYTQDISNRKVITKGITLLGIPYETTYSKSKIKNMLTTFEEGADIVVAHSQLKRRIRLFDLDARLIVTGHYDRKLFEYDDRIFVSLDNDAVDISYATVETDANRYKTGINIKSSEGVVFRYEEDSNIEERSHVLSVDGSPAIDLRAMEMHADVNLIDNNGDSVAYMKYLRGIHYQKLLARLHQVREDQALKPTLSVTSQVVGMQITENYKVSESLVIDFLGKRTR